MSIVSPNLVNVFDVLFALLVLHLFRELPQLVRLHQSVAMFVEGAEDLLDEVYYELEDGRLQDGGRTRFLTVLGRASGSVGTGLAVGGWSRRVRLGIRFSELESVGWVWIASIRQLIPRMSTSSLTL